MGDRSKIEWTDASWNPIRARNKATGKVGHFCEKLSAGCKHCYAARMQPRFGNPIQYGPQDMDKVELFLDEDVQLQPLRWKRPRMVFVCSMTDLFGAWVPQEWIDRIWAVMALCPQHTFQVLTKRAEGMAEYLNWVDVRGDEHGAHDRVDRWGQQANLLEGKPMNTPRFIFNPLPNVWLGVSVEDQATADARIPHLLRCPAAVRWLSVEPMLGPVDLWPVMTEHMEYRRIHENACFRDLSTPAWAIHWVVCGGESGPKARPMHPDWARSLRDQCAAAGVEFFFKQWGVWQPGSALDFDRNVVLLNNGERLPYTNYQAHITLEQSSRWGDLRAVVMHRGWKKSFNELDGRTHQEWPAVAVLQRTAAQ